MANQIAAVFILATIFGGIALIIGVYYWGVKMTGRLPGKSTPQQREEETRLIQEIYLGLTKMEERIETLETILMESKKSEPIKSEVDNA